MVARLRPLSRSWTSFNRALGELPLGVEGFFGREEGGVEGAREEAPLDEDEGIAEGVFDADLVKLGGGGVVGGRGWVGVRLSELADGEHQFAECFSPRALEGSRRPELAGQDSAASVISSSCSLMNACISAVSSGRSAHHVIQTRSSSGVMCSLISSRNSDAPWAAGGPRSSRRRSPRQSLWPPHRRRPSKNQPSVPAELIGHLLGRHVAGGGKLADVPAAAEGLDQLHGGGHLGDA